MSSSTGGQDPDGGAAINRLTCGGGGLAFDIAALDRPGVAELGVDPAAAALRGHLAEGGVETDWLPDAGWIEVARGASEVLYLARGDDGSLYSVTAELGRLAGASAAGVVALCSPTFPWA